VVALGGIAPPAKERKAILDRLAGAFQAVSPGPHYTAELQRAVIALLRSESGRFEDTRARVIEAVNAVELDVRLPKALTAIDVQAGESITVDFGDVARATLDNVEKPGRVSMTVKGGMPAVGKGFRPGWPMATYTFRFSGAQRSGASTELIFSLGKWYQIGDFLCTLRILEWDGKVYRDVTTGLDLKRGTITGRTDKLSSYVIVGHRSH
jgi:hypothetical protein